MTFPQAVRVVEITVFLKQLWFLSEVLRNVKSASVRFLQYVCSSFIHEVLLLIHFSRSLQLILSSNNKGNLVLQVRFLAFFILPVKGRDCGVNRLKPFFCGHDGQH